MVLWREFLAEFLLYKQTRVSTQDTPFISVQLQCKQVLLYYVYSVVQPSRFLFPKSSKRGTDKCNIPIRRGISRRLLFRNRGSFLWYLRDIYLTGDREILTGGTIYMIQSPHKLKSKISLNSKNTLNFLFLPLPVINSDTYILSRRNAIYFDRFTF